MTVDRYQCSYSSCENPGVHSCRQCGTLVCGMHQVGASCRSCVEYGQRDFERKGGGTAFIGMLCGIGGFFLGLVLVIVGIKAGAVLIVLGILAGIIGFIWSWIAANTE